MMGSSMFRVVDMLADLVWAGLGFGTTAIAGIGAAQLWVQISMGTRMGIDTAVRAMVSRAVGAANLPLANHVALQGFSLSTTFAFLLAVVGIVLTPQLMAILGVSDEVIAQASTYMRIQFMALGINALTQITSAILQASGDSMTPFRIQGLSRLLHLALSPLLIFGWGIPGFGGFGIAGAAVSNAVAAALAFSWLFYVLLAGKSRLRLSFTGYSIDFPLIWRMIRLGAPASANQLERTLGDLVLFLFVSPFGTTTVAAYSLSHRAHMMVNFGGMGMGQASGVLVGQNLGAGKPQRARYTVAWAVGIVTGLSMVSGAFVIAFPSTVLSVFSPSPELMETASVWLRIQAVGFMFVGASMVFNQSFSTAGDTLVPMIVTLITVWGVQQPLAHFLPGIGGLGQYGVALAPVASSFARHVFYIPYFFWGPWLKKKVF
ncbi:MAG: hypothetical protein BZY88_14245 [SAR202 cluster bacterium Io17-Chloro-G9]|nr:MAG: hypothetical protein BZY88_14245 [SAR202 cluster bacterium Io17-Chloro-G9]